ncbi:hypothetical protein C6P40_002155 [Pichia californica]|uniref:Large ribosomal subunit protein mL50 n=1 Tax=Pichia californica TaxID=460514 RepID=A0A9P6WK92_9ASCO|nr:hypothetical protein C6P42_002178 [[Candida] californica]KAG0687583.1 hypothetical protein C6P40_002155 [[Candida] californica]
MYPASRIAQQQTRSFSTTRFNRSVLDYFKFFKKKDQENVPQPKATTEVMKDLEQHQDDIEIKETIEVLGRKNPRYTDKAIIKENLKGFQIHRWIPKSNEFVSTLENSENYQSEITKKLDSIFSNLKLSKDATIDDLFVRFNIFKTIQKVFILQIPDSQFTHLNSFNTFETYLITNLDPIRKLSKKSEFQPDAVDFDTSIYEGTNVSIGEWTFEKEKEKAYKNLLKKASKLEKASMEQFKESSQTKESSSPATQ